MSVLRYLKHAPLLLVGVACTDPGAAAIAQGNRAALAGHMEEAVSAYRQACSETPGQARAHALLGNALWAAGKGPEALVAWQDAVSLEPHQPDATIGLARLALQRGAATTAIELLSAALTVAPSRPDLQTSRAIAFVKRDAEGDLTRALGDSEAAARAAPKSSDVLYTRASVLTAAKRFNEAQAILDALERADPRSALAPYGLARLAAAQARKTDVMLHLRSARAAAGTDWLPTRVAADPAFAFLKDDPDFAREVSGR